MRRYRRRGTSFLGLIATGVCAIAGFAPYKMGYISGLRKAHKLINKEIGRLQ